MYSNFKEKAIGACPHPTPRAPPYLLRPAVSVKCRAETEVSRESLG